MKATEQGGAMAVNRVPVVDNPGAVTVSVSTGQFLHFILGAGGPIPIFAFASGVKGLLFEAPDFPTHPTTKYEWDHFKNPSDIQQLEQLELRMSFLTNAKYTYTVELRDSSGVVGQILNISYTGDPTDVHPETFMAVTK
jgi:hypothetical protein